MTTTLPAPADYMCGLTYDGTLLWHSDQDAAKVYAIDPGDGHVVRSFDCPRVRADLTFHDGLLGQVGGRPKRIVLLDPSSGSAVGEKEVLPASGRLTGLESASDGFWMILRGPTVVQLRDRSSMAVLREFSARGASPSGLTYADGVVVYGDFELGMLYAMDPLTGDHLGSLSVGGRPTGLTWDGEFVWYCDFPARAFRAISLSSVLD